MNKDNKYIDQLKQLHENPSFGVGIKTKKHYQNIYKIIEAKKIKSILDYGCGKGNFINEINEKYKNVKAEGYDIANEEFSKLPERLFDMTVCLDVMEHIEFGTVNKVLQQIRNRTDKYFICSIANYPARAVLPDGRNAHLTQLPFAYWFSTLSGFFRVDDFMRTEPFEALFICSKLNSSSDWR